MAENRLDGRRGKIKKNDNDRFEGSQVITLTDAEVVKDGTAIVFDPPYSAIPKVTSLTVEDRVDTNVPDPSSHSVEVKTATLLATGMTIKARLSAAPNGATKTVALTIRYVLEGKSLDE